MSLTIKIIFVLFAHFILDYPLQGDFLAQTKGKYWYSLLVHSLIYGLGMSICFYFIGVFALWKVIILVLSHIIIDYIKANAKNKERALTSYLYIDQTLHIFINFVLIFV